MGFVSVTRTDCRDIQERLILDARVKTGHWDFGVAH